MTVFFSKKKELHFKLMQVLDRNGILCMCGEGKFPARILRGFVGRKCFLWRRLGNWRQDQLRHKGEWVFCVEQSHFRVALLSSNARQGTVWISLRCPEPSCNSTKALMQREGHRLLLRCFSHVGLLLKREEGAPWAVFLSSWEDPIRSQFGGGHLGPLDGWPGGGDRGMWSTLEVVWGWKC